MKNKLTIGLFGFGCVGTGLYEVLNKSSLLQAQIKHIVIKDASKKRILDESLFSTDAKVILNDPEINVVVELINDYEAAYALVSQALKNGKHVVSANKKLIAYYLEELLNLAKEHQVSFLYEASVGGSIPIIRNLEEYYNNDSLSQINGIVNGTTNYILTKTGEGLSFQEALKQAQELGFAELDPTSDVDGYDAKYKLVLLIKHAFGLTVNQDQVWNYGIRQLKTWDATYVQEKGLKVKLIAFAARQGNQIVGFVAPHFLPKEHFAYNVENEFNAVVVEALFSDRQLFLGKGAGSHPTASAVLSDISALQFDYAYEYKKSSSQPELSFNNEFSIKVYISASSADALSRFQFTSIDERYEGPAHAYNIGTIRFSEICDIDWNNAEEYFLAVFPDTLSVTERSEIEHKQYAQLID